jgi:hypothetical protein
MHVIIPSFVHSFDVSHYAHAIVATVIQPPHKGRNIHRFLRACSRGVDGGSLRLRKTKRHIHSHATLDRQLGSPKALADTRDI